MFLELKASPPLLQTYCCSLWSDNSVFVSSDHRVFLQKGFFFVHVISSKLQSSFKVLRLDQELLSCTAASQLVLMENTLVCGNWQLSSSFLFTADLLFGGFWLTLDILNSFLSAAGDSSCFLVKAVTQLCHALYTLYFTLFRLSPCSVYGWVSLVCQTSLGPRKVTSCSITITFYITKFNLQFVVCIFLIQQLWWHFQKIHNKFIFEPNIIFFTSVCKLWTTTQSILLGE